MNEIKIVICDDHPIICEGLQIFINQNKKMKITGIASSGAELKALLLKEKCDVLLLDINLPDCNGLDLCAEIKKQYPEIKIIGFSNNNERSYVIRMLSNNASGYIVKSAPLKEIEQAIEKVFSGGIYLGEQAEKILASIAQDLSTEIPPVTKREKEVLHLLSKGLSSAEIAKELFVTTQTIDSHRKNLLLKFSVNKTINLLQKAKEIGLL